MSKTVRVLNREPFKSVAAALRHYDEIRKSTPEGELIPSPEREIILDIYSRYCKADPCENACKFPVDVTTGINNDPRSNGVRSPSKCFYVIGKKGELKDFSMKNALNAIADNGVALPTSSTD